VGSPEYLHDAVDLCMYKYMVQFLQAFISGFGGVAMFQPSIQAEAAEE
jgi:hypothetical protein